MGNKNRMAVLILAGIMALVAQGGRLLVDEARELLSVENLNSTNMLCHDRRYQDLVSRIRTDRTTIVSPEFEAFVVASITSMTVSVSTSSLDDGILSRVLEDRGKAFGAIAYGFHDFPNNAELCLALARYIGTIKPSASPTPLAYGWGGAPGRMILSTNKAARSEQTAGRKTEQDAWQRMHRKERERQMRIRRASEAILLYRLRLLKICRQAVDGCRKTMARDEYNAFIKEMLRLSEATQKEASIYLGCGGASMPDADSSPKSSELKHEATKPNDAVEVDI